MSRSFWVIDWAVLGLHLPGIVPRFTVVSRERFLRGAEREEEMRAVIGRSRDYTRAFESALRLSRVSGSSPLPSPRTPRHRRQAVRSPREARNSHGEPRGGEP